MYDKMARLGLVTLELLLADLREPVLAGDLPVRMDLEKASYERVGDEGGYDYDCDAPAGGESEDGGCGCGGDGCGDGSCGGGCGGGCGAEMMTSMEAEFVAAPGVGPIARSAVFGLFPMRADPVGDGDRTRDRSPRPERKRLPWSPAGLGMAG